MVASPFPVCGFCMVLPLLGGLQQYICYLDGFAALLLLQQVSPMDDVILVSFSYFCGFGGENRCF